MSVNYHAKFEEGQYYHIYNRTNGNDLLFLQEGNYIFFLNKWKEYISPYFNTYAYCLMSNHFHFVLSVRQIDNDFKEKAVLEGQISINVFLEDQFKRFFNCYAAAFNKQQNRHGSLFQKRFKRVLIYSNEVLRDKICYVHHNPIHHDMSPYYETWRYSSYMAYTTKRQTTIDRHKGLSLFNGTVEDFTEGHEIYRKKRFGFLGDDIEKD